MKIVFFVFHMNPLEHYLLPALMVSILPGCGCIMPKNDPFYNPPPAPTKVKPKQVAGFYSDPWRYAFFSNRHDLFLNADGTGQMAVPFHNVIDNESSGLTALPVKWSMETAGDIQVSVPGVSSYSKTGSNCLIPPLSILRWSPDGLHNMTTGRFYPRFGSPVYTAKLNKVQAETQTRKDIDDAVNALTEAATLGAVAGMAAQGAGGLGGMNPGAMGAANAMGNAMGAASLGMWTSLGNGTWLYNDGNLKGTVNEQGYFYGTYGNNGKVSLRNPGTFTPGQGKLSQ